MRVKKWVARVHRSWRRDSSGQSALFTRLRCLVRILTSLLSFLEQHRRSRCSAESKTRRTEEKQDTERSRCLLRFIYHVDQQSSCEFETGERSIRNLPIEPRFLHLVHICPGQVVFVSKTYLNKLDTVTTSDKCKNLVQNTCPGTDTIADFISKI